MSDLLRLFWAVELPEPVRESLTTIQRRLKRSGADARWVRPEGIHLTVKFLGNAPAEAVEDLIRAAQDALAGLPRMNLRPSGVGAFPRPKSPRVVWAGLTGDTRPLAELAGRLDGAMAELGFPPETRPFSPHLTLGRVKSGRGRVDLVNTIAGLANYDGPPFTAGEITLFRSRLGPDGAKYESLAKIELIDG